MRYAACNGEVTAVLAVRVAGDITAMKLPGWARQATFVAAAIAFTAAIVTILRSHPELLESTDPVTLLAVVALVPLMVSLNAAEYRLSGRYIGLEIRWRKALEITVLGSAANMLPIPGAVLVRSAALAQHGSSLARGSGVTFAFAGSWIATACLYSGAFLWAVGQPHYGFPIVVVGGVALVAFCALTVFKYEQTLAMAGAALIIKLAVVACEAGQLFLCCQALGLEVTFADASAMQLSALAGSAFAIVPAGLGVREGVGALLAELIGLGRARGFLAVALNRVCNMAVLIPVALILSARDRREKAEHDR
jgi:uncharacterized membrane protein YbhN (UPF0104 family)